MTLRPAWACLIAAWAVLAASGVAVAQLAPARAAPAGYEIVTFQGAGVMLDAALYQPSGRGPFPTVVALHGCAGLTNNEGRLSLRHADWGRRLARAGFIVLFPDSYTSRDLGPQCRVRGRSISPGRERVADLDAALAWLAVQPFVKPSALSLLGWSNGGSTVLDALPPARRPPGVDFARAVAFYPGCRVPLEGGRWSTRVQLLVLIGAADDWTPAAPCADLAKANSAQVTIQTYPGAYHDFDHPRLAIHLQSGLAFTAQGGGSAHTGTDPAARADALSGLQEIRGAVAGGSARAASAAPVRIASPTARQAVERSMSTSRVDRNGMVVLTRR